MYTKYQSIGILVHFGPDRFYKGDLAFRWVSIEVWVHLYTKYSSIGILSIRVWVYLYAEYLIASINYDFCYYFDCLDWREIRLQDCVRSCS